MKLARIAATLALAVSGVPGAQATELRTQDGLALVIDARSGRTSKLALDAQNILTRAGGLLIQDFAAGSAPRAVRGAVVAKADGKIVQEVSMQPEQLRITTTHEAQPGCIRVRCGIEDLRKQDRAIVATYRLPVTAKGWRWGRNVVDAEVIGREGSHRNAAPIGAGAEGAIDLYPFSAISGPKYGLSLAIRMDEPRVFASQYRADLQCYEIHFHLGLSQATTKFPGRADVSFVIYRHDPSWGFRSAAARYYSLFPEFFTVRVDRMGGWYCNTRNNALGKTPHPYDYHFAYHECSVRNPVSIASSNRMGIYTFDYTEPWFFWQLMPTEFLENGRATVQGGIRKLKYDQEPTNHNLLTRDGGSAKTAMAVRGITYDDFVRRQSRAVDQSLLWDRAGTPRGKVMGYPWGQGQYRVRFPLNLDPDLPDGAGVFLNEWIFEPSYASAKQQGCTMDGMYLDSYGAVAGLLNLRKEHFAVADIPLTFDQRSRRPALVNDFSAFEWLTWLTDRMHKRKQLLLTNYYSKTMFFNLIHWDAIGSEGYRREDMRSRTLCYRKPFGDLAYNQKPKAITRFWWREYLLYATFPGQELREREAFREVGALVKREMAAGWEPVTYARCASPGIHIERYGRVADGNLHLAVQNTTDAPIACVLALDPDLGLTDREVAWDLLNDRSCQVTRASKGTAIRLRLLPGETTLLMVATPTDLAAGFLREAHDYWADVMRIETYPAQKEIAAELDQLLAVLDTPEAMEKCVASLRRLWTMESPPHAWASRLVERALNAVRRLEVHSVVIRGKEGAVLQGTLAGIAADRVAAVAWSVTAPKGWQVDIADHTATVLSGKLRPPQQAGPKDDIALFLVRAHVRLRGGKQHIVEQRLTRLTQLRAGKVKRVLVADDLEGENPLAGFTQRGGASLAKLPASCGIRAEAAAKGKRGYRLTDSSSETALGVRTAFFEPVQAGDIVRAAVTMRLGRDGGATLYLQCWRAKEKSYTLIKTSGCKNPSGWERVVAEAQIPVGTTALTCEVFSGTSSVGTADFDDIELKLFEPQEKVYWR